MPQTEVSESNQAQIGWLRELLQEVEQQIASRDTEIDQLRQSVQELTDRSQMLEQALQEIPQIYHQKFAERLLSVRDKVERLQQENYQLHTELHSVSYCLAVKTRRSEPSEVDSPAFSRRDAAPIPAFGHAD
jgi:molecular chaperone GrpE (heat shock protein)